MSTNSPKKLGAIICGIMLLAVCLFFGRMAMMLDEFPVAFRVFLVVTSGTGGFWFGYVFVMDDKFYSTPPGPKPGKPKPRPPAGP